MKVVQASGQTCNQFWIYSNFLADAIERNEKFAIWVPDITLIDFTNLMNSTYIKYPLYSKRIVSYWGYYRYMEFINTVFNNKFTLALFKFLINRFTIHQFEISDVFVKKSLFKFDHLGIIMDSFLPSKLICSNVLEIIGNIKESNNLIVGVHLRMGDYKTYQNGKYYYSNFQYVHILQDVLRLFNSFNVAFLLISNEEIDKSFFLGFNCYFSSSKIMAEDLYLLSQADYILGPPSTFSAWASLYKNSSLYFIENPDADFKVNEFIDIKSLWF